MLLTMLILLVIAGVTLDGCDADELQSPLSLTLWSYKGSKSQARTFALQETQRCYKLSSCVLENVSFAKWSRVPHDTRLGFFQDDSCRLLSYYATWAEEQMLAFDKEWVSENVSSVMVYDYVSTTFEYSTECSDL